MRHATFAIEELTIDKALQWASAVRLQVHQDEPVPGVPGLIDWSLSGTLKAHLGVGPAVKIEARTEDGRVFRGDALVTLEKVAVAGASATWRVELQGTGPLDGLNPAIDLR